MTRRGRSNPFRARGMTVLELLIATAITVISGLALSTVLTTVARSLSAQTDSRSALQRAHAAYVRLRAYCEPGLCLLQHDPSRGFAIWLDDAKQSETVNLREMRAVWLNRDDGMIAIERVVFPEAWPVELQDSFDLQISSGADFLLEMEIQRALGYTQTEILCDGVVAASLQHDAVEAQSARTFRLFLTMDDGSGEPPQVLTVHGFPGYTAPR